ncbi:MAG: hypothetical protein GXP18_02660 [Gammaproteobacteria bacterium]|nr:hypothetical protein [Gammaproteobacteria bacterium]
MKQTVFLLLLFFTITFTIAETGMTIQQVKEKYQAELMVLPGVVSIGIGLSEGETVIKVGLDGRHPGTEKALPKKLEGYSQDTGTIRAR